MCEVKVAQSCLTLCNHMGVVCGILQARTLEWVAIPLLQGIFLTQGPELRFPTLLSDSLSSEPPRKTLVLVRWSSMSFKLGFSCTWTKNFQMYKLGLEKAEEPEIRLSTFVGSRRKQGSSRKTSTSSSLTMLKPLTVIIMNCGKFLKRCHFTCLLRNVYVGQEATVRTKHGIMDWFKIGERVCQGCTLSPWLNNQSTSREMLGWMNHRLKSRLPGEIAVISDRWMIPLQWQKVKRN